MGMLTGLENVRCTMQKKDLSIPAIHDVNKQRIKNLRGAFLTTCP